MRGVSTRAGIKKPEPEPEFAKTLGKGRNGSKRPLGPSRLNKPVHRRRLLATLSSAFVLGACGASTPPVAAPAGASASPSNPTSDSTAQAAGRRLPRHRTGHEAPQLTIVSEYPVAQYVFVDEEPVGTVLPGATTTFTVPEGVHQIVCADSADPADNPTEIEETFDFGYGYTYRLHAE